ncbi:acyl-CoA N-acyltransferase [Panus rudis PR-1116 ss-1]|nr:acyl-CoA N-acyltransferase [Panus rudis PR-1116 ss-1]
MAWVNSYKPPTYPPLTGEQLYGPDPYDINFVFPIQTESLESERVKLTPFIPRIHAKAFEKALLAHGKELYRFYPFIPSTLEEFLTQIEHHFRPNSGFVLFAILDKTKQDENHPEITGGTLAGVVGLYGPSAVENLAMEIGYIIVFPEFQRSYISSNSVGILLKYCLDLPTASPPGLGLRRVQWHCHSKNEGSKRLAQRMGFALEGVMRWHWVLPETLAKDGKTNLREGDPYPNKPGRDTTVLAICWDDWENGMREKVQEQIDRRV